MLIKMAHYEESASLVDLIKSFEKTASAIALPEIKSFEKIAHIAEPLPEIKSFEKLATEQVPLSEIKSFVKEASIEIKESHKGSLHEALGIPLGEPIPTALLKAKQKTASGPLAKKINFALNARKWKHK